MNTFAWSSPRLFVAALVLLLIAAPCVAGPMGAPSDTKIHDELAVAAYAQSAPSTENALEVVPTYMGQESTRPWAGLLMIPSIALVLLFPVIASRLFPQWAASWVPQVSRAQP